MLFSSHVKSQSRTVLATSNAITCLWHCGMRHRGGTRDRSVSYPFFSGYGRDEAFPQDTDLSPVPHLSLFMEKRLSCALFLTIRNLENFKHSQDIATIDAHVVFIHDSMHRKRTIKMVCHYVL